MIMAHTIQDGEIAYARRLSSGEPLTVLDFEARYRPVIGHAVRTGHRRWGIIEELDLDQEAQNFVDRLMQNGGQRLRDYRGHASFGAWLYAETLWFLRTHPRYDPQVDVADPISPTLRVRPLTADLTLVQRTAQLRERVSLLTPFETLLLRLFVVENLDSHQVARALGKSASAIRMAKAKLIEKVRKPQVDPATSDDVLGAWVLSGHEVEARLQRIDLQLPEQGIHLTPEALATIGSGRDPAAHQAHHLAGCDACVDVLTSLGVGLESIALAHPELSVLFTERPVFGQNHPWRREMRLWLGPLIAAAAAALLWLFN